MQNEGSASGRQQEIFEFVRQNPGTHLREIRRRLSISSMGNLEHHMTMLKRLKLVMEQTEGGYKRYYPVHGAVGNKRLLALLRQKNPRRIALLILENMRRNGYLDNGGREERRGRESSGAPDRQGYAGHGIMREGEKEVMGGGGNQRGMGEEGCGQGDVGRVKDLGMNAEWQREQEAVRGKTGQGRDAEAEGEKGTKERGPGQGGDAVAGVEKGTKERGSGQGGDAVAERGERRGGLTPLELMGKLGLKPSALSYYLSRMRKLGVLEKRKVGKNVFYVLTDPAEVLKVLISHRESFMDRLVNSFMDGWGL